MCRACELNEKICSVDSPIGGDGDKALLDILTDERGMGPELETQDDDMRVKRKLRSRSSSMPNNVKFWLDDSVCWAMSPATLEDVGREDWTDP